MIGHAPQYAAFLIAGATALQLPTPTPEPRIPLSELESLLRVAASEARQLSENQMLFIIGFLVTIAVLVYLWKRPKTVDSESVAITALDTTLKRYGTQYDNLAKERVQIVEEATRQRDEQDKRYIESFGAMSDSITSMADATKALKENSVTTQALITQLMTREDRTATALDTMVQQGSEPLRKLITMAETMLEAATEIKDSVARIECQQSELRQALETIKKTEQALTEIAEDTGKIRAIVALDTDNPAAA